MMTIDLEATLAQTIPIARQAGAIVRRAADAGYAGVVQYKSAIDLVTATDRTTEVYLVDALTHAFPAHHIHGEEGGSAGAPRDRAEYTWLVDPIDGTTNFAHGLPYFAVSLALVDRGGEPVVAVVYDPMRDECFTAAQGCGAHRNGAPIRVSHTPELAQSLVCSGFPSDRWTTDQDNLKEWRWFFKRAQGVRRIGSAALDLSYVAMGRLDLFWEQCLHPWDILAGALVVQEAGGAVTDFAGGRAHVLTGRQILATNGLLHEAALEVFRLGDGAPPPPG
ncbi:MAG: inositol monophosphatase [Anaerolineae bacterium]|nr:inositol monophosphatase [Anaerolineae bacterium]